RLHSILLSSDDPPGSHATAVGRQPAMNDTASDPTASDLGRVTPGAKMERVVDIPSWDVDPATPLYRIRPIALLFTTRVASNVPNHRITVAVGYQVYDLTESASLLGLIGLAQFLPPLVLMLFAGQVSDRFNRRQVLRVCYAIEFCSATGFVV